MKKITIYLIIIIILYNFIFCNNAYATNEINDLGTAGVNSNSTSSAQQQEALKEGTATDGDNKRTVSRDPLSIKAGMASIAMVINCVPLSIQALLTMFAYDGQPANSDEFRMLTIEDIVFGDIEVLNIDFFDDNCSSQMIKSFRKSVSKWYVSLRSVAVAMDMIVLIYVGIRMALSVTSSDKAKFKEMLVAWVGSVLLLYTLQYFIAIIFEFGEIFTKAIESMRSSIMTTSFEKKIMSTVYTLLNDKTGWEYFSYSVFFWILVFIQFKFFMTYAKRLITVGFLIVISPIVCMVYAIDKVGDGRAQSFGNWIKELSVNVFIQPMEALIYLIFMNIANEIASESFILTMLFLIMFTRIEKTMLQIFNVRGMTLHIPDDEKGG